MSYNNTIITDVTVSNWSLPLIAPFRVATRTSHVASNVLVKISASSGSYGLGAAAPVEYVTGESITTVLKALEELNDLLLGQSVSCLLPLLTIVDEQLTHEPSARAAVEMAIYDLWAKHWNIPLWQYFGGSLSTLTTDITIPIVTAEEARQLVKRAIDENFSLFKIKIGGDEGHEADLERIAVVAEMAPQCNLRIDANQAFSADSAVAFVESALAVAPLIQLIEQPVPKEDFAGLKYVKDHIDLPVFADESACTIEDVTKLISMNAVDGINIKLMKSGIFQATEIAALCKAHGISLMIGCMLESTLGISAACAVVAGIGGFDFIDLDSHKLLKPVKSITGGFQTGGPVLKLCGTSPGWGITKSDNEKGNIDQ